jgi:hypothetical protein
MYRRVCIPQLTSVIIVCEQNPCSGVPFMHLEIKLWNVGHITLQSSSPVRDKFARCIVESIAARFCVGSVSGKHEIVLCKLSAQHPGV